MKIRFNSTPKVFDKVSPLTAATLTQLPRLSIHSIMPIESCMKKSTRMEVYAIPSNQVENFPCELAYRCEVENNTDEKLTAIGYGSGDDVGPDVTALTIKVDTVPLDSIDVRNVFVSGEAYRASKNHRKNQQDCLDVISKAVLDYAINDLVSSNQ